MGSCEFHIFRGEARDANEPTLNWTIRDFFDEWALPKYLQAKNRSQDTIDIYVQAVSLWERVTTNPPLYAVNQDHFDDFQAAIKLLPGRKAKYIAAPTQRKILVHFQKLWDLTGPKTRKSKRTAKLLPEVPFFDLPTCPRTPPDGDFELEEVGKILGACEHARRTSSILHVQPPAFWKALFIFLHNTGLRISTAMMLRWSMFDRWRKNWVDIPPELMKGGNNGVRIYCNSFARSEIEAIRTPRSDMIFPWRAFPKGTSWLHAWQQRIVSWTDIPEHRRFGFHGFRKALVTTVAEKDGFLSQMVAGHSSGNVAINHYINPKITEPILETIPQPVPVPLDKPPAKTPVRNTYKRKTNVRRK